MQATKLAVGRRLAFPPLIVGLILLAWATLFLWEASPYGRYLNHGDWTAIGLAARLCLAMPAGNILLPAILYVGGWLLMSAAMMLPTALPLLSIFARLVDRRSDRALLRTLVVAGYLLVWAGFGVVAHGLDAALHGLAASNSWLISHAGVVGAAVLAIAGAFQFSPLKYYCLDKCRTPFSFVHEHWRGQFPRREAFLLGAHHGVFCVGCCWAIMLLMFVVGTGSVGWMLALGALMAIEKNVSWGRSLSAPLGLGLLLWSGAIVASGVWRWPA